MAVTVQDFVLIASFFKYITRALILIGFLDITWYWLVEFAQERKSALLGAALISNRLHEDLCLITPVSIGETITIMYISVITSCICVWMWPTGSITILNTYFASFLLPSSTHEQEIKQIIGLINSDFMANHGRYSFNQVQAESVHLEKLKHCAGPVLPIQPKSKEIQSRWL